MIRDMMEEPLIWIVIAIFMLLVLFVWGTVREAKEWEQFKVAHNCKIVGHQKGRLQTGVGPTFSGNGSGVTVITMSEPDRVGWLCNDGVTYWR